MRVARLIYMSRSSFLTLPAVGDCRLTQPHSVRRIAAYILTSPKHRWHRLCVAPLMLTTAAVVGTKIVALLFNPATNFSYSQLQRFNPTPPASLRLSGASPFRYARQPPLTLSDLQGQASMFRPPFGASRRSPSSAHPHRTDERTVLACGTFIIRPPRTPMCGQTLH